jgi:hypothetical protein
MAAYHKVEVSLNTNAVEVGIPSPQTVNVVVPTIGPAGPTGSVGPVGPTGPQGVPGTGLEVLTTQGDILYQGASTGQRLAIGTSGQILRVANGIPSWGNESGAVTSVNGQTGAVTVAVPSASSTTPAALGTAAVGSASSFARADHVHAMPAASDVGALQSAVSIETYVFDDFSETLPARRNAQWQVSFIVSGGTRTLSLPSSSVQVGDRIRVALTVPASTTLNVVKPNPGSSITIATVGAGTRFVYAAQVTQLVGGTPVWLSIGELSAAVGASPLTSSSDGAVGQFSFSDNAMYVCIADNTWRRVPIAAF